MQVRPDITTIPHGPVNLVVHARIRETLILSGLFPLIGLGFPLTHKGLLNAFIERWQPDTSSFHLPVGEMSITLDDVSQLLHIPITGQFYDMPDWTSWQGEQLLIDYLGATPQDAAEQTSARGLSVGLVWLRDHVYHPAIAEQRWHHAARAYLLYLLGCTLFADKSGSKVKLGYLGMLLDLNNVGDYCWGAMALAHLYDQLKDASRKKTKKMAGHMALLQV